MHVVLLTVLLRRVSNFVSVPIFILLLVYVIMGLHAHKSINDYFARHRVFGQAL